MSMNKKTWIDDLGFEWVWDGMRVYCVEAEKEFIEMSLRVEQNGYPAHTEEEAEKALIDGGYITSV